MTNAKADDWEMIRCQFCERESRRGTWLGDGDICPDCGMKYAYAERRHAEKENRDGPLCGQVPFMTWCRDSLPQRVTCGRCIKILSARERRATQEGRSHG